MLIFNNTQSTGTFSVTLRDKFTQVNPTIYLKLTKMDDLEEFYFDLTNESTSDRYKTFTIATNSLERGNYLAEIFEGYISDLTTCTIDKNNVVQESTVYLCNPLTLEAELTLEEEAAISEGGVEDTKIYETSCRVQGDPYESTYRNSSSPTYYTYDE